MQPVGWVSGLLDLVQLVIGKVFLMTNQIKKHVKNAIKIVIHVQATLTVVN